MTRLEYLEGRLATLQSCVRDSIREKAMWDSLRRSWEKDINVLSKTIRQERKKGR